MLFENGAQYNCWIIDQIYINTSTWKSFKDGFVELQTGNQKYINMSKLKSVKKVFLHRGIRNSNQSQD